MKNMHDSLMLERYLETSSDSVRKLYDNDEQSIYSSISDILNNLEAGVELDNTLREPLEILQNTQIQIQEASDLLRRYQESVGLDPERLDWVSKRLSSLHDLSRKHQTTPKELFAKWQSLQSQLEALSGDDYDLDALQEKLLNSEKTYKKSAEKLSLSRHKVSKQLSAGCE